MGSNTVISSVGINNGSSLRSAPPLPLLRHQRPLLPPDPPRPQYPHQLKNIYFQENYKKMVLDSGLQDKGWIMTCLTLVPGIK